MKTIIAIVATVFISIDFEKLQAFFVKHLSVRQKEMITNVKIFCGGTLLKCIASYAAILGVTFLELCIGLSLLKVAYAPLFAFLIAILDILPILGTGSVLIPWGIIAGVNGDYGFMVGIFLIYLTITVVRNIIEPKLVGKQVGLHPVLTLMSMLLGLRFFGVVGLMGFPIGLAFLKDLREKKLAEQRNNQTEER